MESNRAYEKFLELVKAQGGDITYVENYQNIEFAKYKIDIVSRKNGNIKELKAKNVGEAAGILGAGRIEKTDEIDNLAGVVLYKKEKITLCRNLLGCKQYISKLRDKTVAEKLLILYNRDICKCKNCGEVLHSYKVDGRYMLC